MNCLVEIMRLKVLKSMKVSKVPKVMKVITQCHYKTLKQTLLW